MKTRHEIIGFNVLHDGRFIKVLTNKTIEIIRDDGSVQSIEVDISYDPENTTTLITALSEHCVAIAYNTAPFGASVLAIIDLEKKSCITTQRFSNNIDQICELPNRSLLVTSEQATIFRYSERGLIVDEKCRLPQGESWKPLQPINCVMLSDKIHMAYTDQYKSPAILRLLDCKTWKESKLQLGPDNFKFYRPEYLSYIKGITQLSNGSIACVVESECQYWSSGPKYSLHVVDQQFKHHFSYQLSGIGKIMLIDNQYMAMLIDNNVYPGSEIQVQLFNLRCKKIKEINFSVERSEQGYSAMTPDGRLATCTITGVLTLHDIRPHAEKLRAKLESVLVGRKNERMLLSKEAVNIISDYAGFFREKPVKNGIKTIRHPDNDNKRWWSFKK